MVGLDLRVFCQPSASTTDSPRLSRLLFAGTVAGQGDAVPGTLRQVRAHVAMASGPARLPPPRLSSKTHIRLSEYSMKPLDGVLRILDWCDEREIPKIIVTNAPRIDGAWWLWLIGVCSAPCLFHVCDPSSDPLSVHFHSCVHSRAHAQDAGAAGPRGGRRHRRGV